jgi:hypothetical protein
MSTGIAALDFGAFPGKSDAALDVATVGVISTSMVEAWIAPAATADHSADEHRVEGLKVTAVWKVNDAITINGIEASPVASPVNEGHRLYGVWNIGWVWV